MTGAAAAVLVGVFAAIAIGATFAWARLRVRVADDNAAVMAELAAKRGAELELAAAAMTNLEDNHAVEVAAFKRRYRELAEKHGDKDAMAAATADRLRVVFGDDPARDGG